MTRAAQCAGTCCPIDDRTPATPAMPPPRSASASSRRTYLAASRRWLQQRETLRYNPNNAITGIVERVWDSGGASRVHKELRRPGTVRTSVEHWVPISAAPAAWNYWHREADVYGDTSLPDALASTGLGLPAVEMTEHRDGISLWLEDVAGTNGSDFSLADHVATAAGLGRWQGRPAHHQPSWASRGFLRDYTTSRPDNFALLDSDDAWSQPLIRETSPAHLRPGWQRLVGHREELLQAMEHLPRAVSHLDAWVSNAIRRSDGVVVLIDWAFAGDGSIGEDLGNYLPDAVFDLFWAAEDLADLEAACYPAYVTGLRDAGWEGSRRDARLGVVASCVKWVWLLPLMLQRASNAEHHAYHRSADAAHLYQQRGVVFSHLIDWCDEALQLTT